MTGCISEVAYDFDGQRPLVIQVSQLDLSTDVRILLAQQTKEQFQICQELANCVEECRDPNKIEHILHQLISQRVYQGGFCTPPQKDIVHHKTAEPQ